MTVFAKITKPEQPRSTQGTQVAVLYAGILVVMAAAQLFSFEKFIPLVESFWLPGGHGTAVLVASLIVVSEVFALPFLLRMPVSPLMRIVSMACGWLAALLWIKLSLWANVTTNALDNVGLLGASVKLPPGWWAVLVSGALLVLSVWASWALWPSMKLPKKHKK